MENLNTNQQPSEAPAAPTVYCMVALRSTVVFPLTTVYFDVARDKSLLAINKSMEENQRIFLVAQKNPSHANPAPKDIHRIGTLARVKQIVRINDDTTRVFVVGLERRQIDSYVALLPHFEVTLTDCPYEQEPRELLVASHQVMTSTYDEFRRNNPKISNDLVNTLGSLTEFADAARFALNLATAIFASNTDKQRLLAEPRLSVLFEMVCAQMRAELELVQLEKNINAKVRKRIDKSQREYYLREQQKVISDELNEGENEAAAFHERIDQLKFPPDIAEKLHKEVVRLEKMSLQSPESGVIRNYLETVLEMPWCTASKPRIDLARAREVLDADHYGLQKVKERIIEFLAVHKLTSALRAPILCFVGPPGVGKTSIVSSIARASGRKLVTMSLGGVRDEAEIRGHRRTYIGAMPGRIISGIRNIGVNNPVFLLDEIDKMSSDFRGDPASAMLEVLDPNVNLEFKDHFLEIPFDLSRVMFVTTANTVDTIPPPLLDRMEVIELSGYTYEEKLQIARRYLLPKQIQSNGLHPDNLVISDEVLMSVIERYTRESGVRNLEREIATICRKVAVRIVEAGDRNASFAINDLEPYLGAPRFDRHALLDTDEVGLATGLAWTSVGGKTLNVEVTIVDNGKGEIKLTGNLGDVMKESCHTALTLVRSRADKYGISVDRFNTCDIHIHVPEGATPKDGPSAGITIATAILSAMTERPISRSVAMTGEVTLRGSVLAIGGLKEKSMAAFRSGITRLILPRDNQKDLSDIPQSVRDGLQIVFAENIDTVFDNALL